MRKIRTDQDAQAAHAAAAKLPAPTQAAIEDRDGFRFAAILVTIHGRPHLQWELLEGTGYTSDWVFGKPVPMEGSQP